MFKNTDADTYNKKVIIDSDMGWDDVLSILYLIKCPFVEIIGLTVTGCGETNLRWGNIIALTLMALGKQTQATVCSGTDSPTQLQHAFPQDFRNDMNDIMGLLGSLNPEISISLDKRPAWQYLSEALNEAEQKVTILSIGGFTNLAKMLQYYPDTKLEQLEGVYAMAGAVFVDGNVRALNNAKPIWDQGPIYGSNYLSEWNIFIDPLAAEKVFKSNIPLTLVPLDACNSILLSPQYHAVIEAVDPIAKLAKDIFLKKTGGSNEGIPVPIFDPLAAMIMTGRMKIYESKDVYLNVCTIDTVVNNKCGNLSVTSSGTKKIRVILGVSQHSFEIDFANVMNVSWAC